MPALRNISRAQSEMGDIEAAKATADLIPDALYRAEALSAVAAAQASSGNIAAARATAALVRDAVRRATDRGRAVSILADTAVEISHAGAPRVAKTAIDAALAVADKIRRQEERRSAFSRIVVALADMGRPEGALMMLDQVPESVERRPAVLAIAASLARAGHHRRALELVDSIDGARYRALVLAQIGLAQGKSGDNSRALETMSLARAEIEAMDATLDYPRAYAMSRLTQSLVEIGEIDAGFATATEIEIDRLRAHALWTVAAAQASAGATEEARRSEALSLESVDAVASPLDRAWLLSNIAVSHARAGHNAAALKAFRRALDVAKSIEVAWARAQALGKVAATLVELN
jgi:tetratricopeptide (TPR) repeat protein